MYDDLRKTMIDIIMAQTEEAKDWLNRKVVRDLHDELDRVKSDRDSVSTEEDLWA